MHNIFQKSKPKVLKLKSSLEENIALFREIFSNDDTFMVRRFQNKNIKTKQYAVLYFMGMTKPEITNQFIIKPIMEAELDVAINERDLFHEIQEKVLYTCGVKESNDVEVAVESVLSGRTLLLINGFRDVLIIKTEGWQQRAITEPPSEKIVRGPREGFTETLVTNLTMIRRKIQSSDLKFQFKRIGKQTHTKICVCYLENIASPQILQELYKRLDAIDIDGILDSGYIQELIQDAPFSPFNTIGATERPDVAAAKILEGRIAVIVDGSPFVLTLPYLFVEYFQYNEDYYDHYFIATFNRMLRIIANLLTIIIPAFYIALVTYHQEMLPTPLLLSISAARQGVPLPTVIEAMLMIFTFELLREAGTRMPTPIGQAVSIVGALVLGQAAVDARLVSAPMIIISALTGITSLVNVRVMGTNIVIRLVFILCASVLGLFGLIFAFLGLVIHIMELRSFGVPFALNMATIKGQEIKDTAFRAPWWAMRLRVPIIASRNMKRLDNERGKGMHE